MWEKPEIKHAEFTKYGYLVWYPENLKLGNNVDIGALTLINAHFGVEIGDNVQIGSHCSIYSHNTIKREIRGNVIIEKNAQIGSYSLIMPNTIIKSDEILKPYTYANRDKRKTIDLLL